MRTIEQIETSVALVTAAVTSTCMELTRETQATGDQARRTMIALSDSAYGLSATTGEIAASTRDAVADLSNVVTVIACVALVALFLSVYVVVTSDVR